MALVLSTGQVENLGARKLSKYCPRQPSQGAMKVSLTQGCTIPIRPQGTQGQCTDLNEGQRFSRPVKKELYDFCASQDNLTTKVAKSSLRCQVVPQAHSTPTIAINDLNFIPLPVPAPAFPIQYRGADIEPIAFVAGARI
ncbi:uncharacterized protein CLUP02_03525 [Colletotrichum lupini]|uniref:Uncharacterized protein n=1 Tax=Colletotrichum lupini TaxID=145971 RepID=A0A9Q8WCF5_9PEZI|nr:uncharacterized protein CLUP02_03525 [Colletotrichum lupini]UQC78051.1 hypothetical protein CLUP02_03525 [Colletotrichum lupini]